MFLNEGLTNAGFEYMYGGLRRPIGYVCSRLVKLLTCWTSGADLHFKPYKLRPSFFLRRFLIAGTKQP